MIGFRHWGMIGFRHWGMIGFRHWGMIQIKKQQQGVRSGFHRGKQKCLYSVYRQIWRYQRGNQNPYIEEEQTTQWIIYLSFFLLFSSDNRAAFLWSSKRVSTCILLQINISPSKQRMHYFFVRIKYYLFHMSSAILNNYRLFVNEVLLSFCLYCKV